MKHYKHKKHDYALALSIGVGATLIIIVAAIGYYKGISKMLSENTGTELQIEQRDEVETTNVEKPITFDSEVYLEAFPDIKKAIEDGLFKSAVDHFQLFGLEEKRINRDEYIEAFRAKYK